MEGKSDLQGPLAFPEVLAEPWTGRFGWRALSE